MKRLAVTAALALLSLDATAVGRAADVTVLDRDSGRILPTYYSRGEYWVAGSPGARYGIEVRNHTGERVLAVMAVDGVNVVTGETAGWGQSGYVFAPRQSYDITGWRKSNSEVAAFLFSTPPDSYAARTGRAANIGVIGVALFRERLPIAPPLSMSVPAPRSAAPTEQAANDAATRGFAGAQGAQKQAQAERNRSELAPAAPSPALGTGHGEREGSYVENTEFERRQATPDEVIRIRYDSQDNLVAMGVFRKPMRPPTSPNAFPDSTGEGFVADPPGYSGRGLR